MIWSFSNVVLWSYGFLKWPKFAFLTIFVTRLAKFRDQYLCKCNTQSPVISWDSCLVHREYRIKLSGISFVSIWRNDALKMPFFTESRHAEHFGRHKYHWWRHGESLYFWLFIWVTKFLQNTKLQSCRYFCFLFITLQSCFVTQNGASLGSKRSM